MLRPLVLGAVLAATSTDRTHASSAPINPDELVIVDCLLPGQVRKLGGSMTYLGPRHASRLPAFECEIRGGEYVAYDRANYSTALHVWLSMAEGGDAQAQVYVGEIYEKGMGVPPDYAQAATWYAKAAKQGNVQGLNHSAYLYEQGLGVDKDPVKALNLYRQAAGLTTDELTFVSEVTAVRNEAQSQIDALSAKLDERDRAAEQLAASLSDTRRQLAEKQADAARSKRAAEELREKLRQLQSTQQTAANAEQAAARAQEIAQLKAQLADRESTVAAQSAAIDKLQHASAEESGTLQSRLAEAQRDEDALRQQLGSAQGQLAADRVQLENAKARTDAIEREARDLKASMQTTQTALAAAQEQLRRAQAAPQPAPTAPSPAASAELDRLRQQSSALQAAVAQQQVQLEREKAVIAALNAQGQQSASEQHRLEAAVSAAQAQHQTDKTALAKASDTESALRAQLAGTQSELLRRTVERDELASKVDIDARQIDLDGRNVAAAAARLGAKDAEVQRLNAELANRESTLSEQRAQLAALTATVNTDAKTLDDYKQRLATLASATRSVPVASVPVPASNATASELGLGQNYALIVGNAEYAHLPQLKTAAKDATDVGRLLSERYGFKGHTQVLINATRAQIMNAFYELDKTIGKNDNFVIYYAGHGTMQEASHHSYWMPIDADADNPANWISDQDVTRWVAEIKARHVLIVADSCYSGEMIRGSTAQLVSNGTAAAEKMRMVVLAKMESRTVLTSGGVEPVLDSGGPDGHSIFAHEFIEALSTNSQIIEATSLYTHLAERMRMALTHVRALTGAAINQSPQIAWLADAGHQTGGEFLFVPIAKPAG